MGLACRITRNKLGGVEKVEAPNGNDSLLYRGALASTGNEERALGIWATAYTPDFMNYYGDWENPTPESMFNLDANGEPLLQDVAAYYPALHGPWWLHEEGMAGHKELHARGRVKQRRGP